ncbi:hypothetical protein HY78_14655 [Rhizorhabdus wittichii DC-6]|nr:hypothetical protein HY78_14655 [Rhizorhabdus wittichii DC-6]
MTRQELYQFAQSIVDSEPVISVFAASEWDELNDDGKNWIMAIVAGASAPWQPIAEAPAGDDTDGPFFDVAWSGRAERLIGCYKDRRTGNIMLKHGYPAVWTIFNPPPSHFMIPPALPVEDASDDR